MFPPELDSVIKRFGLEGVPQQLSGGSQRTFRVGDFVFKQIRETSLENNHSPELAEWVAEIFAPA